MKFIPLLILWCLVFSFARAQNLNQSFYFKMPSVIPPSPDVASMEKFGNFPVSYNTGTTSITVPISTVSCGEISWPVSISYHTGGLKVEEIASNVGLGWALLGEATITRAVMGKPDESSVSEPNYSTVTDANWAYLYDVLEGIADSEMDVYSYNFNGKSGKFLIKQDGTIFLIPYNNLKITSNAAGFVIVDETGLTYTFDRKESVTSSTAWGNLVYTSAWKLSKVQTADKKQSIDFVYQNSYTSEQDFNSWTQSVGKKPSNLCAVNDFVDLYTFQPIISTVTNTTTFWQLKEINFPNGSLVFNYTNDRTDIDGTGKGRLTSVDLKTSDSEVLQSVSLSHSYFPGNNRLKLNSVKISRGTSGPSKTYAFEYNSTNVPAVTSRAQDKWGYYNGKTANSTLLQQQAITFNSVNYTIGDADRSTDTAAMKMGMLTAVTWPTGGRTEFTYDANQYYTGFQSTTLTTKNVTATGVAQTATTNFTFPSSSAGQAKLVVDISRYDYTGVTGQPYVELRDITDNTTSFLTPNLDPATPLHLEQSISLTAGHVYEAKAFVFCNNGNTQLTARLQVIWSVYTGSPAVEKGAGVRIRMIKNFTDVGKLAGTEYFEYEPATTLTAYNLIHQQYQTIYYKVGVSGCGQICFLKVGDACRVYNSGSIYPASLAAGSPLMYSKVTKYQLDPAGNNKGKSVYEYDVIQDQEISPGLNSNFPYFPMSEWRNGSLLKESHYSRSGSIYNLIKTITNSYGIFKNSSVNNLMVKSVLIFEGCRVKSQSSLGSEMQYYPVPIFSGVKKLIAATEVSYESDGNAITTQVINQFSAPSHDYVSKTMRTDSKQQTISTTYKYPVDFSATGNVYEKMINANITSPVIESKVFKEVTSGMTTTQTLLSTVKTTYKDWMGNATVLKPEFIQGSLNSDPLKNKIVYSSVNDFSRTLEISKYQDKLTSYIWDYNFMYPVVEAVNASFIAIACTSFEADSKGRWAYSGVPIFDITAPTGTKCYNTSNALSRAGLPAGTYIVSYWKKSGTVAVNSTTAVTGKTINGWTYYEHEVTVPASGTVTVSGSNGIIDELRLYPATNALVTTYTFKPLVGITSQCDPNNKITYYEYDELGRLILTRDEQKNILRKFAYDLAGTPENESIFYNVIRSQSFQKQGCTGCTSGSSVPYSVPAGKYLSTVDQATADAIADAEIAAKGQAYANDNGSCTTPPSAPINLTTTINKSVQLIFHNTCTGVDYTRNIASNVSNFPLTGIPQGNYNVTFNVSPTGYHTFKINAYTIGAVAPVTISNTDLSSATNTIIVQ